MGTLNPKQQRFVDEYLIDLNAKQAAIRAGYSVNTAEQQGSRLLGNVEVQTAIQEAIARREKRTEITQDRVLQEYAKLAFLDPRKFYDEEGNLIPIHKLDADVAAALTGVDVDELKIGDRVISVTKKIKHADKKGALDSIAKHLGMFVERTELTGKNGGPIETVNRPSMTKEEWLASHGVGPATRTTD